MEPRFRRQLFAHFGMVANHVHQKGKTMDAPQIFEAAVGTRDPVADLMRHLKGGLVPYGVAWRPTSAQLNSTISLAIPMRGGVLYASCLGGH